MGGQCSGKEAGREHAGAPVSFTPGRRSEDAAAFVPGITPSGFVPGVAPDVVASTPAPPSVDSFLGAVASSTRSCRYGFDCVDFSETHRAEFKHPEGKTLSCQYGSKCYRRNLQHMQQFVHPGDRNYRLGLVHFPVRKGEQVQPEFSTLRSLFNYCDPDESGNISQDEFQQAWECLSELSRKRESDAVIGSFEEAWEHAASSEHTHLTFAQFAKWASDSSIGLPVGIDLGDEADRVCRFHYAGGKRCACAKWAAGTHPNLCECGHKSSMHLSDIELMTVEEQEVLGKLKRRAMGQRTSTLGAILAPSRKTGFTMVTNKELLADLQRLLTESHKLTDNWTRDRGCAIHGRNKCGTECIMRNRAAVPTGYELVRAEQNRNTPLWQTYATTRSAIKQECSGGGVPFEPRQPLSSLQLDGVEPLECSINEWRLLHGTSDLQTVKSICGTNFRMKLAGTGATWKDAGKPSGTPLYGFGVYLAECITKADEYTEPITDGLPIDNGCCAVLVCRVVGGLSRLVDSNEFDTTALRTDVFDGPYHSVFGDRVSKLGKPYREVVVYNEAQIFPEFVLYYRRLGLPGATKSD